MKYAVIIAAILLVIVSCKSQSAITSASNFKPLSEVESISLDAQNFNNKIHFTHDTLYIEKEKFLDFYDVKGVDMGAQNYNNSPFTTDTIYIKEMKVDSPKN